MDAAVAFVVQRSPETPAERFYEFRLKNVTF